MLLNKHNLHLHALASQEATRFSLNAIMCEPGRTMATDGKVLGIVTAPNLPDEQFPCVPGAPPIATEHKPFLMPVANAKAIEKALPKRTNLPIITCAAVCEELESTLDGTRLARVITTDLERSQVETIRVPSGRFPDIDRVIPNDDVNPPKFEINLDARLIKRLMDQYIAFHDTTKGEIVLTFSFRKNTEPVVLTSAPNDLGQTLYTVCMPCSAPKPRKPKISKCEYCGDEFTHSLPDHGNGRHAGVCQAGLQLAKSGVEHA